MPTSRPPLHVAFVWHMHQPHYRSARDGAFAMPWARMHALKDYPDMVQILSSYPDLHQTFNLVPSLVEQLEVYASGDFTDTYWEHALKPADALSPEDRAFVLERLCERADHPRARSHTRYLELASKRDSLASLGWGAAADAFSVQELRDLQIWSNLAWFGKRAHNDPILQDLVQRGRGFVEEDKKGLAAAQAKVLKEVLPAYVEAAAQGRVELTTSPYFHPILPLLCDTDSARIASPELLLPSRRFSHPEDAAQQLGAAIAKHREVFGVSPRGVWCSEMAVGESLIPLLTDLGVRWTIADEAVLTRSLSGVTRPRTVSSPSGYGRPYWPYRLERETGGLDIVFRDHTLSDLIGFTYKSWDSREAAADLLSRLRELHHDLPMGSSRGLGSREAPEKRSSGHGRSLAAPLVVVALDGENAWEYYPNEGRDFLGYLYEGLSADPALRCVTVSEHLDACPVEFSLDWLHTGSWVFSDLSTWCGTEPQNTAWDELHRARDLVAGRRESASATGSGVRRRRRLDSETVEEAWRNILVAEGSDWFWWFGEHHHTELDAVWDHDFRLRLQEVYRLLGEPIPDALLTPLLEALDLSGASVPTGPVDPAIDGVLTTPDEWSSAGRLTLVANPAMQPSAMLQAKEVRFGWRGEELCLLISVERSFLGPDLWIEVAAKPTDCEESRIVHIALREEGGAELTELREGIPADKVHIAWKDVVEISLCPAPLLTPAAPHASLLVRVGSERATPVEFRF